MDERGQRIEISAIQLSCNISLSEQNAATSLQKKGKEKKTMFFLLLPTSFWNYVLMCLCFCFFYFYYYLIFLSF